MNYLPYEIISNISSFLTDGENLVLSTVTKQDWKIEREKCKKNIIYRWVNPILTVNKGNWFASDKNELLWIENHMINGPNYSLREKQKDMIMYIQEFSNNLLSPGPWRRLCPISRKLYRNKKYDYPIISYHYIKTPRFKMKSVATSLSLEDDTKILEDEYVCAVYKCRLQGKIRRAIKTSLLLKALIG
jgi:hypothetical protein